jgi:hypothetical protein
MSLRRTRAPSSNQGERVYERLQNRKSMTPQELYENSDGNIERLARTRSLVKEISANGSCRIYSVSHQRAQWRASRFINTFP